VKTSRDDVVVDIDKERLIRRMKQNFDHELADGEICALMPTAMTSTAAFDARKTRRYLIEHGFKSENVVRYSYRPFDNRWIYWEPETALLDRKREEYFPQIFESNIWLSAGQRNRKDAFYQPQVTKYLADDGLPSIVGGPSGRETGRSRLYRFLHDACIWTPRFQKRACESIFR